MSTPEQEFHTQGDACETDDGARLSVALCLTETPEMELEIAEVHCQVMESRGATRFLQNAAERVVDAPEASQQLQTMAAVAAAFIVAGRLVTGSDVSGG